MKYQQMYLAVGTGDTAEIAAELADQQWESFKEIVAHSAGAAGTAEADDHVFVLSATPSIAYDPDRRQWGCVVAVVYTYEETAEQHSE
jgi:hypothetical protein